MYASDRWSRSDSLVVRSHYVRIDGKNIFRVDRAIHGDLDEGDYVHIRFYPHSATIVDIEKVPAPPDVLPPPRLRGL